MWMFILERSPTKDVQKDILKCERKLTDLT